MRDVEVILEKFDGYHFTRESVSLTLVVSTLIAPIMLKDEIIFTTKSGQVISSNPDLLWISRLIVASQN
jgi:hypothetical protein